MYTRSLNKLASIAVLFTFLVTPSLASAQGLLGGSQDNSALGGMSPLLLMMMMQGGRGGSGASGAGGSGGVAQVGQFLALAGLLSGNMGLAMAGLLTSMLGGLASSAGGGAGSTPQTGQVDEQYVAPGAGGPASVSASSPYYTTPTPNPSASPAPACSQSIFIVNDTTASPATTKPYPSTLTLPQSDCALVINTDTANHSLSGNSLAAKTSQVFRFASKKVYKMCVDASTTACTSVTVQ